MKIFGMNVFHWMLYTGVLCAWIQVNQVLLVTEVVLYKYIWESTGLCPTYRIRVEIFGRVLGGAKVDHPLISPHLIICTNILSHPDN